MKYNKLFVYGLASVSAVGLSSCEDAYNIRQAGEKNNANEVYNTIVDFERGLNGVYELISTEKTIEFTAIFTDEVAIGVNNGGQGLGDGQYQFQLTSGSDAAASIWQSNYIMINFANRLMAQRDRVKANIDAKYADYTEEDTVKWGEYQSELQRLNDVMAQLYAIRAFGHFQLLSWFSTDPSNPDALGVMKLDFFPEFNDYSTFLPRVKNSEIYTLIDSDLEKATTFFADGAGTTDVTRVSPNFITALKARMALYRKDYTTAASLSQSLIGNYSSALQKTADAYSQIVTDASANESIFRLARVLGDFQIGSYWASARSSLAGSPFFEVSRSLYDAFKETPSDIRAAGENLIDATSVVSDNPDGEADYVNSDILVINRYPGNSAQGDPLLNDIKVFSMGEMYLIRAEALANLGQLNGVSNSNVNKTTVQDVMRSLRRARFAQASYANRAYTDITDALSDIQDERRKELAFAGHRYLDIKRLGPVTGKSVDRYYRDCQPYSACDLSATSYKFTLPIPNTEITANPSIRGQQNPNY